MTEQQPDAPIVEVVRGNPTDEELAALVAIVSEAYTTEVATAVAEEKHVSAWMSTRRPIRTPLRRDIPWGRFSG
ncbi:acyl-CoA carboxylase subunit epsilon [Microbacterium bovistercoris]|uniref:Acyl-CoA carboxylase subunit epsilon n=1 Tax=Microbacterium bovistercoris TaxID=2293570 RepID=A0A371NRN4_9MICO|nr:acyl-CoA carboxylase subunit epsilon [Microbacterium bovistercoris]REJ04339.1 acyl-CoA carboxylase subunit epsilon [Microbacterium bovistercoris]